MKEQGVILPVDEPLVFHLLGHQTPTDALHVVCRYSAMQSDRRFLRGKRLGLPICWCSNMHMSSTPRSRYDAPTSGCASSTRGHRLYCEVRHHRSTA